MKIRIVCVDVLDITVAGGWWSYDRRKHRREQHTIPITGCLVDGKNEEYVVLASGYNKGAGDWLNEVSIPRAIVKRIRTLEYIEA